MLTIAEYVKPNSIDEAYQLLTTRENAVIVGGGFFMRMSSRKIGTAIDLSRAGLDFIRETDEHIEIGAMTTFSRLMRSDVLQKNLDGLIPATLAHLPGEQIRNMVSVGGTVCGMYAFSELLTSLMVLNCRVALHRNGVLSLADFFAMKGKNGDILEKVIIQKDDLHAAYQMFRNSAGSLPVLTAAVSKNRTGYKIAVGARPGVATLATEAMAYLNKNQLTSDFAEKAAEIAASELEFTNDRRASGEYRRELCKTLVKRAILEAQR